MSRDNDSFNFNLESFDPAVRGQVEADIKAAESILETLALFGRMVGKAVDSVKSVRLFRASPRSA